MDDNIYKLRLHESVVVTTKELTRYSMSFVCTRVPGGFIYVPTGLSPQALPIFVPMCRDVEP